MGGKNAEISIEQTGLNGVAAQMAQSIAEKFRFSARGYTRLARVARTVADLAESAEIRPEHVAEAATFRVRLQG
jgi:magnesium chelatase family protein